MILKVVNCMSLGLLLGLIFKMTKRKPEHAKRKFRVALDLDLDTIQEIDKLVIDAAERPNGATASRAGVCRAIIDQTVNRSYETREEQVRAHSRLIRESSKHKERAQLALKRNDQPAASSQFLLAAAKELEALSIIGSRNESTVKSSLIQVLQLLKRGTGYNKLPEVPASSVGVDLTS